MSVHVIIDSSNVIYTYFKNKRPDLNLDLFTKIDQAVLNGRPRGQCAVVRSQQEHYGQSGWQSLDLGNLKDRGYSFHSFPLSTQSIYCERCHQKFLYQREKKVDGKIIELLFTYAMDAAPGDTLALVSGDKDFESSIFTLPKRFLFLDVAVWSWRTATSSTYAQRLGEAYHPLDDIVPVTKNTHPTSASQRMPIISAAPAPGKPPVDG